MNMIPPRLLGLYRVVRRGRNAVPPVGGVRFGSFQLRPFSRWGYGRGTPIDRSYIDRFLAASRIAITGDVLEFGDAKYTQRFGGDDVRSHVLHVSDGNPAATIVADITQPEALAADAFDCIVCTQTLQQLYDVPAAIRNLHRSLRPGGALLATVPCISQIDRSAADRWGDFWRFTPLSIRRLFCESFSEDDVTVSSYGNVLASTAFLYGVAAEELDPEDLDRADADYPMLIAIRAGKPAR